MSRSSFSPGPGVEGRLATQCSWLRPGQGGGPRGSSLYLQDGRQHGVRTLCQVTHVLSDDPQGTLRQVRGPALRVRELVPSGLAHGTVSPGPGPQPLPAAQRHRAQTHSRWTRPPCSWGGGAEVCPAPQRLQGWDRPSCRHPPVLCPPPTPLHCLSAGQSAVNRAPSIFHQLPSNDNSQSSQGTWPLQVTALGALGARSRPCARPLLLPCPGRGSSPFVREEA